MTTTLAAVKDFVQGEWPSPRRAEAAANIRGCELLPWVGETHLAIDGEIYQVVWMNRKHSALLVVPANPPED